MTIRLRPLAGTVIAATAALGAASAASATSPASFWFGVERIAVRCGASDARLSAAERKRLCDAVAAQLRSRSAYPVISTDASYVPDLLGDLVVTVDASPAAAGKVLLAIQPVRMGNGRGGARNQPVQRVTIASGARGARLGQAIAGAVNKILPAPQGRRGRVPTPQRAS